MERVILANCAVFVIFVLFVDVVLSQQTNYDTSVDTPKPKDQQPYFWFGPRIGRRKRNQFTDGGYKMPSVDKEQLETLMDAIQDSPWAVVAINDGKRHTSNYTPRLGRESGEDFGGNANSGNERWLQDSDVGDYMYQRSPPFAPRLGRRMSPFSPRLGRENDKIQQLS